MQLLEEAGYGDGFEVPIILRVGAPDLANDLLEAAATMWENIGLTTSIQSIDRQVWAARSIRRENDEIGSNIDQPGFPEPLRTYELWDDISNGNFGFEHPWISEKLAEARITLDEEERWAVQAEIARFLFDNVVAMPAFAINSVWPLGPEVGSWEEHVAPAELDWGGGFEYAPRR